MKFVRLTLHKSTQKIWVNLDRVNDITTAVLEDGPKTTLCFGPEYVFFVSETAEEVLGIRG